MSRGISASRARTLRQVVHTVRAMRADLETNRLDQRKRMAAENVARLREQLTPGYRLNQQRALAYWEAAVDSLEDDGVMPEPKENR